MPTATLLLAALVAFAPAKPDSVVATGFDACNLMSGASQASQTLAFVAARDAAERGDFPKAAKAFVEESKSLSARAEELFFDGNESDQAAARAFLDQEALDKGAVRIRNDSFTLSPEALSWGAYLACKARGFDSGLAFLKIQWRDWGTASSRDDAVLLLVASGAIGDAAGYVAAEPGTVGSKVAQAIYLCGLRRSEEGAAVLEEIANEGADETARARLSEAATWCRNMATKKPGKGGR